MKFYPSEIPLATQMIDLSNGSFHPFQSYYCLWSAFNNIYVLIGKRLGLEPKLRYNENGEVNFRNYDEYKFPIIDIPSEYELINHTINCFSEEAQKLLISHKNIEFYVNRKPYGIYEDFDIHGQLINGVVNISRTVDNNFPVWSPINKQYYEEYCEGNFEHRLFLLKQIVFLLYTIRNNLVHGGKNPSEANDVVVV